MDLWGNSPDIWFPAATALGGALVGVLSASIVTGVLARRQDAKGQFGRETDRIAMAQGVALEYVDLCNEIVTGSPADRLIERAGGYDPEIARLRSLRYRLKALGPTVRTQSIREPLLQIADLDERETLDPTGLHLIHTLMDTISDRAVSRTRQSTPDPRA